MALYAWIMVVGETPETMQSWQDSASAGKGNAAEVQRNAENKLPAKESKVKN
jgi:hypothetical protein